MRGFSFEIPDGKQKSESIIRKEKCITTPSIPGALVIVGSIIEQTGLHIEPVNLIQKEDGSGGVFDNTLESALAFVKLCETAEVKFDLQVEFDESEVERLNEIQSKIDALEWDTAKAEHYYVIVSPYEGPLEEDGTEYRFYPVAN